MSPLYGGGRAEVECPGCGTTIRARMADQPKPDDDLRLTVDEAHALSTTLKFRIDLLKGIERDGAGSPVTTMARAQIDALVAVAEKLRLP